MEQILYLKLFPSQKKLLLRSVSGLVVQLVRIHACHAWGRGFESRPDRNKIIPS